MIIDIICLAFLAIGFWMGYSRGIIQTIFGLLSLFFGMLIAFKFSPITTNLLEKLFGEGNALVFLLGFVLTFIAIMLLVRLLARGIEKLLQTIQLNFLNKIAGGVLLSMVFGVIFSVLLWFTDQAELLSGATKSASLTYPILEGVPAATRELLSTLKPLFSEFWNEASRLIDEMGSSGSR